MTAIDGWFALISGETRDIEAFKADFRPAGFTFETIDGRFAFTVLELQAVAARDYEAAIAVAAELIDRLNITLRLSHDRIKGLNFETVIERRDGHLHRVIRAESAFYNLNTFYEATITVSGGAPQAAVRRKQVRLYSLLQRDKQVEEILRALAVQPPAWAALSTTYETIVGLVSGNRNGYQTLIDMGWMSAENSERFYHSAAYHRHGYPKEPNRATSPMSHKDAVAFIGGLLWKFVDQKEPR